MAYMNDDLPYDEYIKKRELGRAAVPQKRFYNKSLTTATSFYMTPKMKKNVNHLIEKGFFPNKAEFLRYLIIRFFEEHDEWLK